jgi:hypothetical protein
MPASSWIAHVKAVYAKGKSKGMSYKDALRAAAKTWKKGGGGKSKAKAAAPEEDEKSAPRKRKRKRARPGPGPDEKNIN